MTGQATRDFPTTPDALDRTQKNSDAFVTKVHASGATLDYSTYLGGAGSDYGKAIAIDNAGVLYMTGGTDSSDFPTTPGRVRQDRRIR